MDTLRKPSLGPPGTDAPVTGFLPAESALPMAPCRLDEWPGAKRPPIASALAFRRLIIFSGTGWLTAAGGYEMYDVLKVGGVTDLEAILLAIFLVLLAWIAFSFMSALAGFCVLLTRCRSGLPIDSQGPLPDISSRTAMLLPTYNEDPHYVTARLRAMYEQAIDTGRDTCFDWFLLSDSTDPNIWIGEELALTEMRRACAFGRVYYRHRADNVGRKSGNIAEWVRRFGAAYDYMIVLDADSLMAGDTIVRLVHAMEMHPAAALIQTQPIIVNARTLFGRLQQFAGRVYGPVIAAGNAWWQGTESNYWGHNAIIRVQAFAAEAGLPELQGRKPFGGHILSHDFVEAALMRRAGWAIYMAPSLGGSYEEAPPSLLEFAVRDRRWCQGNLQHVLVLPARGLHWISRLHLLTGIGSYLTAPMWFVFLVVGLLVSLQAHFVRPDYFPKGFSLFPKWPQQDPVLAAWVFAATFGLLFVPKLLSYIVLISRRNERILFAGSARVLTGILTETVLAALLAPLMMVFQSRTVAEILAGRDAGWRVQRREHGGALRSEVYRKLGGPTLIGFAMGLSAYAVSVPLMLWMLPVLLGLVLAVPLGMLTSSQLQTAGLFATPEDIFPPPVLIRARELAGSPCVKVGSALAHLRQDPELLNNHLATLAKVECRGRKQIDVPLVVAQAKVDKCESLEEAIAWLNEQELHSVLSDITLLQRLLQMPYGAELGCP